MLNYMLMLAIFKLPAFEVPREAKNRQTYVYSFFFKYTLLYAVFVEIQHNAVFRKERN